jgi:hypothetical protein
LKAALIRQASIDPETVFGKISPLDADGLFFFSQLYYGY